MEQLVELRKNYFQNQKDKANNKLRDSIFGVLYVLLKDAEEPEVLAFILGIIEFLEFLGFPFSSSTINAWGTSQIANNFMNYLGYLNIPGYLTGASEVVYLSVFYMFILIVILVILNIAYVSYSFSRKYFTYTWPLYVLRNVAKIFVTIMLMPALDLFLSITVCGKVNENSPNYTLKLTDKVVCFQGMHYIHMIIALIVSLVSLIICLLVSVNLYEVSETAEDHKGKENSNADFFMFVSKFLTTLLFSYFADAEYEWFLIIVLFIIALFQFLQYHLYNPWYK